MKKIEYDQIFFYKYSPRPETSSNTFPDPVPEEEIKRRFDLLLEVQKKIKIKKNKALVGQTFQVMVQGPSKTNPQKMTGKTEGNKLVHFTPKKSILPGKIIPLQIHEGRLYGLEGIQKD